MYGGSEPLDGTAVHPESYAALRTAIERLGDVDDVQAKQLHAAAEELGLGVPTLADALEALKRRGVDPRDDLLGVPPPQLLSADPDENPAGSATTLADIGVGDELVGVVKNVVDFGAFVDIGVGTDGLLHRSEMHKAHRDARKAQRRDAPLALQVGQQLRVRVLKVDIEDLKRKKARIGLQICEE